MQDVTDRQFNPKPLRKITIGSLATRFGVSCESLRNWERQGLIPPSRRTPGGHRRYDLSHVEALSDLIGPPRLAYESSPQLAVA